MYLEKWLAKITRLAAVSKMFPALETIMGSAWPRHLQKTDIPNPQLRSPLGALSIMVS